MSSTFVFTCYVEVRESSETVLDCFMRVARNMKDYSIATDWQSVTIGQVSKSKESILFSEEKRNIGEVDLSELIKSYRVKNNEVNNIFGEFLVDRFEDGCDTKFEYPLSLRIKQEEKLHLREESFWTVKIHINSVDLHSSRTSSFAKNRQKLLMEVSDFTKFSSLIYGLCDGRCNFYFLSRATNLELVGSIEKALFDASYSADDLEQLYCESKGLDSIELKDGFGIYPADFPSGDLKPYFNRSEK